MKVRKKQDLIQLLYQSQERLKSFGFCQFGIFGSFVRYKANEESDVDILVRFEPSLKTFDNFMGLSLFLEDLLGIKVDLVTIESLSPYISKNILNEVEYFCFYP